jgi:hypothetical protein
MVEFVVADVNGNPINHNLQSGQFLTCPGRLSRPLILWVWARARASEAEPQSEEINVLAAQARALAERVEKLPDSPRKERMSAALWEIAEMIKSDVQPTV